MRPLPASLVRLAFLAAAFAPSVASAHPGHDDPEITWDLSHLVEHPIATIACFALIAGIAWGIRRVLRRSGADTSFYPNDTKQP